jgi:hypothetical protein
MSLLRARTQLHVFMYNKLVCRRHPIKICWQNNCKSLNLLLFVFNSDALDTTCFVYLGGDASITEFIEWCCDPCGSFWTTHLVCFQCWILDMVLKGILELELSTRLVAGYFSMPYRSWSRGVWKSIAIVATSSSRH